MGQKEDNCSFKNNSDSNFTTKIQRLPTVVNLAVKKLNQRLYGNPMPLHLYASQISSLLLQILLIT